MNEELQNQIENIIDEKLMSFTNVKVPIHKHNGVDSPKVNSYDINTGNNQGFVFGTNKNNVNIVFDPATNIFYFSELQNPSTVPLHIGSFKNISLFADGLDSTDNVSLFFSNTPILSAVYLDAIKADLSYTTGVGTNRAQVIASSANIKLDTDDGTYAARVEVTPEKVEMSTLNPTFSLNFPQTNISDPTPVAGGMYYNSLTEEFRACADGTTWQVVTLV